MFQFYDGKFIFPFKRVRHQRSFFFVVVVVIHVLIFLDFYYVLFYNFDISRKGSEFEVVSPLLQKKKKSFTKILLSTFNYTTRAMPQIQTNSF